MVWTSDGQDGSGPGVFGQSFFSTFEPNGGEFQANTFTTGVQTGGAVAVAPDNAFVVVWRSDDQDGSGSGVFGRRFAPDGVALTPEFAVNEVTTGQQGGASIAMDAEGPSSSPGSTARTTGIPTASSPGGSTRAGHLWAPSSR